MPLWPLHSDGAPYTNGQELRDPTGSWRVGQPAPGDPNAVTNPGDPTSAPATAVSKPGLEMEPTTFSLGHPYPNPFNSSTLISFHLPRETNVILDVTNLRVHLVKRLIAGQLVSGEHRVAWDGSDALGKSVPSGVYLIVLRTNQWRAVGRVVLLR